MNLNKKQLRELAQKAVEPPLSKEWKAGFDDSGAEAWTIEAGEYTIAEYLDENTAAYIAAANPQAVIELLNKLASKQARIDELMLEYCPEEMSIEQMAEWAKQQEQTNDH